MTPEEAKRLQECEDALANMMGIFDTPIARMRMGSEYAQEARQSARDYRDKYLTKAQDDWVFWD